MKLLLHCCTLTIAAGAAMAAPTGYYRYPALRGDTVVFTAEGDLWRVPLAGGTAQRLTTHPGAETRASFSPDGKWIAFSGEYEGPAELYVMPAEGGAPKRLTWETAAPAFTGWTADGRVLCATRARAGLPDLQLLEIALDGTVKPVPLAQASEGAWNADGTSLVFTRFMFQGSSTKRYQGGTAQNLWRWTAGQPEAVPITSDFPGTSKSPLWHNGRVIFLTDRTGVMNLWSMLPDGTELKQLTTHKGYDAKSPSLHGDTVVYQQGADLHRLDLQSGQSAVIPITLATDSDHQREKWITKPQEYITAVHISPNGDRVVLTARGQMFVAPVKEGRFVTVPQKPGVRSRYGRFMPDGKSLLALSDESGELEFWTQAADGTSAATAVTTGSASYRYAGIPSPDGKWFTFADRDRRLWLWSMEMKSLTKLADCRYGELEGMAWSPDSAWIAWAEPAANTFRQIHIQNVADNTHIVTTGDRVDSFSPAWSRDGKWLYFLSDRAIRTIVESPWGPRQPEPFFDRVTKIYGLALTTEGRWPFLPPDELHKKEDDKKDDKGKDGKKDDKGGKGDILVRIETTGLATRLYEAPAEAGNYSGLSASGEFLFYVSSGAGSSGKKTLKRYKITSEEPKAQTVAEEIIAYELSANGEQLLIGKKDEVFVVGAGADAPAKLEEAKVPLDNWAFSINPRDEWRQMFTDSWRLMRDWFYDPKMHALDWPAIREKYAPLVERVADRQELSDLISEMVGELSALHIFVRDGDARKGPDDINTASLGADLEREANGWRVARIVDSDPDFPGDLSPLARPETAVRSGDLITAINGVPATSLPHIGAALRKQEGQQVLLTVQTGNEAPRQTIVRPMGRRAAADLRYNEWELTRRRKVEADAKGTIGYVHLRAMGEDDMAQWARDYFPVFNRQGLIVDVRHNQGGNIDSWVLGRLLRKAWMYWQPRVGAPEWNMQYAFRGHVCVLCDEFTASDGEAFSEGARRLGIGKVIGTRTWGGEIWLTFDNWLVDKGIASAAEIGVYGPEGAWLIEGHGVEPDIRVDNLPVATFKGGDAQLDAAIKHLNELIARDPRPVPPTPAYPDKRPK